MIIAVVGQKGGAGKSSVSRLLAVWLTESGYNVLLADVDHSQATSCDWNNNRRNIAQIKPDINTQLFATTRAALAEAYRYDYVVIDGAPHATRGALDAAEAATLVIVPTSTTKDDLIPSVKFANELAQTVDRNKIVFALYKTTTHAKERDTAAAITKRNYVVLDGYIPHKNGYSNALDDGRCINETSYDRYNTMANTLLTSIAKKLKELRHD